MADSRLVADPAARALIFDCDGTLVDSMSLHLEAWLTAFEQLDVLMDPEFLMTLQGMRERDIVILFNRQHGTNLDPDELVGLKHSYFLDRIETVRPIEPVAAVAREQYGRLSMAVASGSLRDVVLKELQICDLLELFPVIITGDDSVRPKPAPHIFLEAASRMGVAARECQVFEDGESGLMAAERAGMIVTDIRPFLAG